MPGYMYCAKPPCIEARLLCRIGLYATSPLDISAFIRDGLVCKFGFYPRLYGTCSYRCLLLEAKNRFQQFANHREVELASCELQAGRRVEKHELPRKAC